MKKPKYRLSPNEVERLVKEERDRRRKLRIVQVREQAKANAASIRNDVRREKQRLVNNLASEIEDQLTAEKEEEVRRLREKYEGTLRSIGEGHREAHVKGDGYSLVEHLQSQRQAEEAARERYKIALERHRIQEASQEFEEQRVIMARHAALAVEKQRAAEVASRPPPPPDISVELEKKSRRAVQMMDMKAFATTHFHIPDYHVVKAGPLEQTDAKAEAEETDLRLKQDLAEKKRSRHEQIERARIRGNEALHKEMLKHDLGDMIQDLSLLQRHDRRRRQKVLAEVPKQVFIPPERCLEERQERQMEMERKFDDLYMEQYKDLGSELQSIDISEYPLTEQSGSGSIHESAETIDAMIPMSRINPALRDVTNVGSGQGQNKQSKEPDTVLKQLLTKIRAQKDGRLSGNSSINRQGEVATGSTTGATDVHSSSGAGLPGIEEETKDKSFDSLQQKAGMSDMDSQVPQSAFSPGSKGHASQSNLDPEAAAANDQMVEELMRRIKLIEIQKQQLSKQFETQTGAFHSLLRSVRPVSQTSDGRSIGSEFTLKEVDISNTDYSEIAEARAKLRPMEAQNAKSPEGLGLSHGLDLAAAMSTLRPVSGIFKGQRNLQYELLTSNGFLPSPELNTLGNDAGGVGNDEIELNSGNAASGSVNGNSHKDVGVDEWGGVPSQVLGGGDAGSVAKDERGVVSGARREIDFGVNSDSGLGRRLMGLGADDGGDIGGLLARGLYSSGGASAGGNSGVLSDQLRQYAPSEEGNTSVLSDKVRQYAASAEQRHAGIDEDMTRRVQEYQSRLLDSQVERRQVLSQVRADIEARRKQLNSSKQSFLAQGIAGVGGVAPAGDSDGSGSGKDQNVGSIVSSENTASFSDRAMLSRKIQEVLESEGRGGLLLSSWAGRKQGSELGGSGVVEAGLGMATQGQPSKWEPIRPFVADPGLFPGEQVSSRDQQVLMAQAVEKEFLNQWSAVGLSQDVGRPGGSSAAQAVVATTSAGSSADSSSIRHGSGGGIRRKTGGGKKDRVRKSLSFEDEEKEGDVSRVSWKDVLLDESVRSEVSSHRLTSEEEESCSPNLGRGSRSGSRSRLDNTDQSLLEGGDDTSGGDKSSVLTGSSSLNGSALVARAEERRLGFERRQAELRQQLADIQQQKDSILHRYQAGQAALLTQQAMLKEKMDSVTGAASSTSQTGDIGDTGGGSQARSLQLQSNQPVLDDGRKQRSDNTQGLTWAAALTQRNPSTGGSTESSPETATTPAPGTDGARGFALSPFTDITLSGRPSLASGGNASYDSYLADISYHKLKNGDSVSLPPSAFNVQSQKDLATAPFPMPKVTAASSDSSARPQTWATLLQASSSSGPSLGGQVETSEASLSRDLNLPDTTSSSSIFPTPVSLATLTQHQPHELSVILEVDTPTSSTATKGGRHTADTNRGQGRFRHTGTGGGESVTNSSQSLSSSQASYASTIQLIKNLGATGGSNVQAQKVESFPEIPFLFSTSSSKEFSLASPDKTRSVSASEPSLPTQAVRKERSSSSTQFLKQQPLVRKDKTDDKSDDDMIGDEDGGLMATAMPYLVADTPVKTSHGSSEADSENSSLQITGFSDYLREKETSVGGEAPEGGMKSGISLSTAFGATGGDRTSQVKEEEGSTNQWVSDNVVRTAEQFGPEVVQRLREQSRTVFGDSTRTEGDGGEGDITLGTVSSLPSMELEEVTIHDSTQDE